MSEGTQRVFTQVFGVVGVILERDGQFLLVKENKPGHPDHGKWNQPAGWIDVGEDPIVSVSREVKEETGLDFTPTYILGIFSLVRKDLAGKFGEGRLPHALKIIFSGDIDASTPGQFDASEISEIRWFTPEEIYAMDGKILRDIDIKNEVRAYLSGLRYPLSLVTHTVQKSL